MKSNSSTSTTRPSWRSNAAAIARAVRAFGKRVASVQVTIVAVVIYYTCLPLFAVAARILSPCRMNAGSRWQVKNPLGSVREQVEKEW
jgi:hypothetical protein